MHLGHRWGQAWYAGHKPVTGIFILYQLLYLVVACMYAIYVFVFKDKKCSIDHPYFDVPALYTTNYCLLNLEYI